MPNPNEKHAADIFFKEIFGKFAEDSPPCRETFFTTGIPTEEKVQSESFKISPVDPEVFEVQRAYAEGRVTLENAMFELFHRLFVHVKGR